MRLSFLGFLTVMSLTSAHSLCAQVPEEVAWNVLEKGHKSHNTKERINAVRALRQLLDNPRAVELAEECIKDDVSGHLERLCRSRTRGSGA